MKNETIKTYTKVASTSEALRLAEAGEKLAFRHHETHGHYVIYALDSIGVNQPHPYATVLNGHFRYAATVTELDPCQAPAGCPELEPWMAYIGSDDSIKPSFAAFGSFWLSNAMGWTEYHNTGASFPGRHRAIDVRTAWAQEHFPEHCRIRDYQKPDAFDIAWDAEPNKPCSKSLARFFYELGQSNLNKT